MNLAPGTYFIECYVLRHCVLVTLLFTLFVGTCQARIAEFREQIHLTGGHVEVRLEGGRYAVTRDDLAKDWVATHELIHMAFPDVKIRRRTDNEYGLEDALRAIMAAGGTLDDQWRIQEALAIGDEAVGVPVLSELYDRMKDRPFTPDLDTLWAELGLVRSEGGVRMVEDAPLAEVRRAIIEG